MQSSITVSLEFSLKWQSEVARHNDRLFFSAVDPERDIFPGDMAEAIAALDRADSMEQEFAAGVLVEPYAEENIIRFDSGLLQLNIGQHQLAPSIGRFYPQAMAAAAMHVQPDDFSPFRLLEIAGNRMVADRNHPLAAHDLRLGISRRQDAVTGSHPPPVRHDIARELTGGGPGMQAPYPGVATDFYSRYPFERANDKDDADFYRQPRLVQHLDDIAIEQVTGLYSRIIHPGMKVLDLMSSYLSHLPAANDLQAIGLGMNQQELEHNRQLSDWLIHDLNKSPQLSFTGDSFDAVICSSSIEYLVDPLAVVDEVARVLKPGAVFMLTFSDRWFPGKQIKLWSELHPFERQGLVLDYLVRSGRFEDLQTETIRGLPRPANDVHSKLRALSDPVFAVWGKASNP